MNHAIKVENLTKIYGKHGKGVTAVDHIDFEVHAGEIFGFLGPNGAGKTTTQRMLTTLLEPSEGRILVFATTWLTTPTLPNGSLGWCLRSLMYIPS